MTFSSAESAILKVRTVAAALGQKQMKNAKQRRDGGRGIFP